MIKKLFLFLLKKLEYLEKEVEILKEKVNKSENIISKNKVDILSLFEKINNLKNQSHINKKEDKTNFEDKNNMQIDEINFIIKKLKESPIIYNKNFQFKLLYRGTRDGDDTIKSHKICDLKKILLFLWEANKETIMEDFKLLDGKVGQKINGNILLITMHFFFV